MRHSMRRQVIHGLKLALKRSPIATVARAALHSRDPLEPVLRTGRRHGWDQAARDLVSGPGREIIKDRRVLQSLREKINDKIEIELLLTATRRLLLTESANDLLSEPPVADFATAIVHQCINNEFVFYQTLEETRLVQDLSRKLPSAASALDALLLLRLSLYRPLHELVNMSAELPFLVGARPDFLDLYRRIRRELLEEAEAEAKIERITKIENEVSSKVRSMYEANPFPRWLSLDEGIRGSRQRSLRYFFSNAELRPIQQEFDVLVPGCGTGRQALHVALGYGANANVLAMDLSRASLAYAARMSRHYNANNVRFVQGDILALGESPMRFHVIECAGVLHHMADTLKGWKILVRLLKPGGIMYITLYSRLARREIVKIREALSRTLESIDANFIREYRKNVLANNRGLLEDGNLPRRFDFFTMSKCRDLLFHVQERQFSIPELKSFISELGLEFRGFDDIDLLQGRYWSRFPMGKISADLDAWSEFEQRNPNTFANLYNMWFRKPH